MIDEIYRDKILIKINDTPTKERGYVIPEGNEEEDEKLSGTVFGVGKNVKDTSINDVVVFGKFDYSKIFIEGVKYVLTTEGNLICKLKENE